MELTDAFAAAGRRFGDAVRALTPSDMARPTPCASWAVRDLVNHVIGGEIRYTMLLQGASTAQVEATRDVDHIAGSARDAFARANKALGEEFAAAGALNRVVHHRLGDRSGAGLLLMRVMEYVVHGWDLDIAVQGEATIDPDVAALLVEALTTRGDLWQGDGVFAPPSADDPTLPAGERLLRRTGRLTWRTPWPATRERP